MTRKPARPLGATHLVIGDAHSDPKVSNERFDWLGRFIAEHRPDVIIDIGDWHTMGSLCSQEEGSEDFRSRRYQDDIDVGIDAKLRVHMAIKKVRGYEPRKISLIGNHEHRITKLLKEEPRLKNNIGLTDLLGFNWKQIPFLKTIRIDGMGYSHYAKANASDKAISSVNIGRALAQKLHRSFTFGHTHRYHVYEELQANIQIINCGCFFTHPEEYAGEDQRYWKAGLLLNTGVRRGVGSPKFYSMTEIKLRYS